MDLLCSVIVPVYNGGATIERCLHALAQQTWPPERFEIIIVDDGSQDDTANRVRHWIGTHPTQQIQLVQQPNAGPAAARNQGASVARGGILLFTDADCAPLPTWIAAMMAAFADPQVAGVKGAYLTEQTGLTPRFVQAEYEDRYDRMRTQSQIDFIDTYSAGYRRAIFRKQGGFDAIFRTASVEDQEFSFRLTRLGHRLVFAPEAQVVHLHDRTAGEYARRKFLIGYWKTLVTRRHPDRLLSDSHTPQSLKVQILLIAAVIGLTPLALLSTIWPGLRWVRTLIGLGVVGFLTSTLPFLYKLARRSPHLALIGPLLLVVRAAALGSGFLLGLLQLEEKRLYPHVSALPHALASASNVPASNTFRTQPEQDTDHAS
jgi:glycosyltransferase involved in cell wall biosynthesis